MTNKVYYINGFKSKDGTYKTKDILLCMGDTYLRFESVGELEDFIKECGDCLTAVKEEREDAKNNQ